MPSFSVIGQSNSIMANGYLPILLSNKTFSMTSSGRIGASPSVLGPLFATKTFFELSFCIFDFAVIDHILLSHNFLNHTDAIAYIEYSGNMARINNCEPIFLIIPLQWKLKGNDGVLQMYIETIKKNNFFYLDVRDLVKLRHSGASEAELYVDSAHVGDKLAHDIADSISRFFLSFEKSKLVLKTIKAKLPLFEVVNLQRTRASECFRR